MVKQEEARKPSAALLEVKKKAREKLNTSGAKRSSAEGISIRDIYQSVSIFLSAKSSMFFQNYIY